MLNFFVVINSPCIQLFSDESSDSDYNPSGTKKHRGGGRKKKKKRSSDYELDDDDDDMYDGYTRTTGRQREHIRLV